MPDHRGRLQAQHRNFDISEAWAQDDPPTAAEGVAMLGALRRRLPADEASVRAAAFARAETFIRRVQQAGGITGHYARSFPVKGDLLGRRVDLEVNKGRAFAT